MQSNKTTCTCPADESQWKGAAAEELWHRIRYAKAALTDEFHRPLPMPVGDPGRLRVVPDERKLTDA